jgi:uncharacterized protein YdaU (DUF1376 family)
MHYYPHHIGDYQRDTAHLSATDHGVYRLLMDHYYVTERPLPGDIPTLCRIVRAVTKLERESVLRIISSFFQSSDKGFVHKRIEAEISEYRRKSEVASAAGKASGEARRNKQNSNEKGTGVERTLNGRSISVGGFVEPTSNQDPRTNVLLEKEPKVNMNAGGGGKPNPKLPTTEPAKRLAKIFRRKLTTEWSDKEIASFKKISHALDPDDLTALENYYADNWPPSIDNNMLRHDLKTLLNNYAGEVDRAHEHARNPQKAKDGPKTAKMIEEEKRKEERHGPEVLTGRLFRLSPEEMAAALAEQENEIPA